MQLTGIKMETTATQQIKISGPRAYMQLEGLAAFIGAIVAYAYLGGNGWMFVLLLLVPDLGMIGYLHSTRLGAWTYNSVHTYVLPLILLGTSLAATWELGVLLALIWCAHIGMDRSIGYGFKYATDFKATHIKNA